MEELLNEEVVNVAEDVVEVAEALPNNRMLKLGVGALIVTAVAGVTVWSYKKYVKPIRKIHKGKKTETATVDAEVVNETVEDSKPEESK